jgi:hypothetical protein
MKSDQIVGIILIVFCLPFGVLFVYRIWGQVRERGAGVLWSRRVYLLSFGKRRRTGPSLASGPVAVLATTGLLTVAALGIWLALGPRTTVTIVVTGKHISDVKSTDYNIDVAGGDTYEATSQGIYDQLQIGATYRCVTPEFLHQLESCRGVLPGG